jgi:hypothetical protein
MTKELMTNARSCGRMKDGRKPPELAPESMQIQRRDKKEGA